MPGLIEERIAGCIKWLPRKEDLIPPEPGINAERCNHPVVILSTVPDDDKRVVILIITSLRDTDLQTKYPEDKEHRRQFRSNYIPIAPQDPHPDNGLLLSLENPSQALKKRSYVNTKDKHKIFLASLKPYNRNRKASEIFLSEESCRVLIQHARFSQPLPLPPPPPPLIFDEMPAPIHDGWLDVATPSVRSERILNAVHSAVAVSRTAPTPRISDPRSERRPLLPYPRGPSPIYYGRDPVLPTTYPIRVDNGHGASEPIDWEKVRKYLKVILWISLALFGSYKLYRAGCWAVAAVGRAMDLVKRTFQPVERSARALWSPTLQALWLYGAGG